MAVIIAKREQFLLIHKKTYIPELSYTSGQKFQKILFLALSCTYYEPNCGSTSLCDQNCGVQPADRQTDRITHTGTDKSLKTEGPKILSNDIFYFRTVIIGGPIQT